ncbi:hypothetical protein U2446_15130, partial [Listeria monocytogenes]
MIVSQIEGLVVGLAEVLQLVDALPEALGHIVKWLHVLDHEVGGDRAVDDVERVKLIGLLFQHF